MSTHVVASKDIGPTRMTGPLILELLRRGHKVFVIAEHLSVNEFLKIVITLYFGTNVNFSIEPFYVDVYKMLLDINPDVVTVSASIPINLEQQFAVYASQMGIPVVGIEDYEGVSVSLRPANLRGLLINNHRGLPVASDLFPRASIGIV